MKHDRNVREVQNKQLRKYLNEAGLAGVRLFKSYGFFFICSDDDTCNGLKSTVIYCNSFRQMTPRKWLEEIRDLLTDEANKF